MFTTRSIVVSTASIALMVLGAGVVSAQDFLNKPFRIIADTVGSSADRTSRLIAEGISGPLGQPVVIENRAGVVQQRIMEEAPPDGHTLLTTGPGHWIQPITQNLHYDPVKDLSPITIISKTPYFLVVSPTLPVNSVKELIDYAKARPGKLNNSVGGIGGSSHLAGELFKLMAGINIVAVPYANGAQEVADLISGQVQMTITGTSVMVHVKSGRLRALAVGTAQPSALAPGVPTIAATLPGFELVATQAMFAPAKTPEVIINRLNREIVRVLNQADVKQKFLDFGTEVVGSSPQELAATIKSEMARMAKLIKDTGIKLN